MRAPLFLRFDDFRFLAVRGDGDLAVLAGHPKSFVSWLKYPLLGRAVVGFDLAAGAVVELAVQTLHGRDARVLKPLVGAGRRVAAGNDQDFGSNRIDETLGAGSFRPVVPDLENVDVQPVFDRLLLPGCLGLAFDVAGEEE